MKKSVFLFFMFAAASFSFSQAQPKLFPKAEVKPKKMPAKKNLWVFVLAGQSNMAGRGTVEPQDTIPSDRILTINKEGQVIYAKEPLHFYEPNLVGMDCGLSFAKAMLDKIPKRVSILLIPTAVGGSAITQWLGDSTYRSVKLFTNFKQKVSIGKELGEVKGILWHQGESDANKKSIPLYKDRLTVLIKKFREVAGNDRLPVVLGELGSYSNDPENWLKINEQISDYAKTDKNSAIVKTDDLKHRGDNIHFDSEGQRTLGRRYADAFQNGLLK
jgi:hypothetical protein